MGIVYIAVLTVVKCEWYRILLRTRKGLGNVLGIGSWWPKVEKRNVSRIPHFRLFLFFFCY